MAYAAAAGVSEAKSVANRMSRTFARKESECGPTVRTGQGLDVEHYQVRLKMMGYCFDERNRMRGGRREIRGKQNVLESGFGFSSRSFHVWVPSSGRILLRPPISGCDARHGFT